MNLLVIGGGGREHAIIKKLRENTDVNLIWCLPGNGGIAADADCVSIGAKEIDGIYEFARAHDVDFAIVAQDDPLALGCVDRLTAWVSRALGQTRKRRRLRPAKSLPKT